MHNLLSRGQLAGWKHFEQSVDRAEVEYQKLNDYYECLIECNSLNQSKCKRVCRTILS
jgi:hypothetical protein